MNLDVPIETVGRIFTQGALPCGEIADIPIRSLLVGDDQYHLVQIRPVVDHFAGGFDRFGNGAIRAAGFERVNRVAKLIDFPGIVHM